MKRCKNPLKAEKLWIIKAVAWRSELLRVSHPRQVSTGTVKTLENFPEIGERKCLLHEKILKCSVIDAKIVPSVRLCIQSLQKFPNFYSVPWPIRLKRNA